MVGTVLFVYDGRPFVTGAVAEIRSRRPGMMPLDRVVPDELGIPQTTNAPPGEIAGRGIEVVLRARRDSNPQPSDP